MAHLQLQKRLKYCLGPSASSCPIQKHKYNSIIIHKTKQTKTGAAVNQQSTDYFKLEKIENKFCLCVAEKTRICIWN